MLLKYLYAFICVFWPFPFEFQNLWYRQSQAHRINYRCKKEKRFNYIANRFQAHNLKKNILYVFKFMLSRWANKIAVDFHCVYIRFCMFMFSSVLPNMNVGATRGAQGGTWKWHKILSVGERIMPHYDAYNAINGIALKFLLHLILIYKLMRIH